MENNVRKAWLCTVCLLAFALVFTASFAFAGTGGAEVQSWWVEISSSLKGYWGMLLAVFFIADAIIAFRAGSVPLGIFFFLIAILIGTVPDIVAARYTLCI